MSNITYETVIGLEVHIQLNSKSKAFCADDTTFGMPANSQISAISLAHPGTLPFFNKKQLESAVRLGLAIGGKINRVSFFDRKNYFYADLPKGFQTTQDRLPVCSGGALEIKLSTGRKKILIHHFHMEEDAGKSIHDLNAKYSLVDLNRSGISLLELVTEPEFRSAEEVSVFMTEIRRLVRWLGISDGNMEEGSLRCDVNLSVRKFGDPLGTRCEMKNINSMRFARKAIEFESARQIALLEKKENIIQQTRSFNPITGETAPLRDKEDAHDYRYFPEPDLPPILVSENLLESIEKTMPEMPWILADIYEHKFGLNLADSDLILSEISTAHFFQKIIDASIQPRAAANFLINKILPSISQKKWSLDKYPISIKSIADFLLLIENNSISNNQAMQRLWPALLENPEIPPIKLAKKLNLLIEKKEENSAEISLIIDQVLEKWPEKVIEFQKGKKGLIGLFTGEVMKLTDGKAEPKTVNQILLQKLAK
jgi:aspartyl-tRNA(Asn)/glutamyl-tRNA(Gln) amidotransferase subunit B